MRTERLKTIMVAALVLAALALPTGLAAQKNYAVVELSAAFFREKAGYEEELGTQNLMGTPLEILDSTGYWLRVRTPEPYDAWVTDLAVTRMDSLQLKEYIAAPKYICVARWTEMWSAPSVNSLRVSDMVQGDIVRIWKDGRGRPVKSRGFLGVILPSGRTAYVKAGDLEDFSYWAATRKATPENIVATALTFRGTPYMWGGTSPKSFDCSGLTRTVYFLNGILLPRNASQQIFTGNVVDISELKAGIASGNVTSYGDLRPGDLLFFGRIRPDGKESITHVGLYIGDGRLIHSSHLVRINSLNPDEPDYYTGSTRLLHARRICSPDGEPLGLPEIKDSPYYFPQPEE